MSADIELSIVIPTKGRTKELRTALESIRLLANESVEILVVDQNPKGFLDEVLGEFVFPRLRHFRVDFSGVSRARNYGLSMAFGRIINFCDDDAIFEPGAFDLVLSIFNENASLEMVTVRVVDPSPDIESMVKFSAGDCLVDRRNFYTISVEFSQFWRTSALREIGGYNESLGVGEYFGAEEGVDLLIRALGAGYPMMYFDEALIKHPSKRNEAPSRCYRYARGSGRLLFLHWRKRFVFVALMGFWAKGIVGVVLYLPFGPAQAARYAARVAGFWVGFVRSFYLAFSGVRI